MSTDNEQSNNEPEKKEMCDIRVFTIGLDAQEQADAQKSESEPLGEEAGVPFDEWYADLERSGRDLQRPAFQKLLADAQSQGREFNAVLVWKWPL